MLAQHSGSKILGEGLGDGGKEKELGKVQESLQTFPEHAAFGLQQLPDVQPYPLSVSVHPFLLVV